MPTSTTDPVRGAYGSLAPGQGFLVDQSSIALESATEAAQEADDIVNEIFEDFDRSGWTEGSPRSITRAWLRVATGEYFDRIQGANVSDDGPRGARLKREGTNKLLAIADAGGPSVAGKQQVRIDDDEADDRSIQIRVT